MTGYSEWLTKNHSKLTEKIELLDENMKFQSLTPEEKQDLLEEIVVNLEKAQEAMRD